MIARLRALLFTPASWREPWPSRAQRLGRASLRRCVLLSQQFETRARSQYAPLSGSPAVVRVVVHAHVLRAIHLATALSRLREHVAGFALIRGMCEAYINLHYILCEPSQMATRAQDFHDFFEVNKLRLLADIARQYPSRAAQINPAQVAQRLNALKPRFFHRSWDWDKRSVVGRAQRFAKVRATSPAERESLERIITLYQEANPHVHGGMFSIAEGMEFDANGTPVRPKHRLERTGRFAAVLTAQMLLEMLSSAAPVLGVAGFTEKIEAAAKQNVRAMDVAE